MGSLTVLAAYAYTCFTGILKPWKLAVFYVGWVVLVPTWNWRWSLPTFKYQYWLVLLLLIGAAFGFSSRLELNKKGKFAILGLIGYLLVLWASYLSTDYSTFAVERYWDTSWKIVLACVALVILLDSPQKLRLATLFFVIGQGWNAWNINQLFYERGINVLYFNWNYLDNNTYSISTIPCFAASLGMLFSAKDKRLLVIAGIISILQIHQIMILQSRGTMLGGVLTIALCLWFARRNRNWLSISLAGLLIGGMLAGPSVVREFGTIFADEQDQDASASGRYALWRAGYEITMDYPWLGVGPWAGQYKVPEKLGIRSRAKGLHNLLLEVSTSSGVISLVFYMVFFSFPWLQHFHLRKNHREPFPEWFEALNLAILIGIPGYFASSFFSSGALIESPYVLTVLGITSASVYTLSTAQSARRNTQADNHNLQNAEAIENE